MSETHIHIHLNGESLGVADAAPKKAPKKPSKAAKASPAPSKPKRTPSAYNQRYSKAFKKLESKYKTKSGSWKKDGYKRCAKAAHKLARK